MDESRQPYFAELLSRSDTFSMTVAFSLLHCKKIQGEISSEQIKTLSSVQNGSAGDRNIWINGREVFLGEVTQRFNNYLLFSVS